MPPSNKTRPDRPLRDTALNRPYVIALLLLPLLVLWRHDDPLYTPLWQADPWFYLGYFRDLVAFKRDLFPDFYYGSRLSWILPGLVAHRLFAPLLANAILHLGVHSVGVLSLFFTLRRTIGLRSAYLSAMSFSFYPWYWAATGWDHVNGAAIAYYLLAMALLTRAAVNPVRRWTLFAAGMATAGAVYAHLYMVAFAPLLALQYLVLTRAWNRTPVIRTLRDMCLWSGIGFGAFTLPLCAINGLWVDGNFWFWSPSLRTAQAVTSNYTWTEGVWSQQMLVPYLWFIVAGVTAALGLLPAAWKAARTQNPAALLFSAQLLFGTALMIFLQARGITLLGHYYYACYLFPFVFLVVGASVCPSVESLNVRQWTITAVAATVLFALPWVEPAANPGLFGWLPEWFAFLLAISLIGVAVLLRQRSAGAWTALAALAMLSFLTYDGSYRYVPMHGTRAEYTRVMDDRQLIEKTRDWAPIRFWYDRDEPAFHEYFALNASYMAEFARVGEHFPQDCRAAVDPESLVVVTSRKEHTPDLAARALTACWQGSGLRPAVQIVQQVNRPDQPYTLAVLKAVEDYSVLRPLRANFDQSGKGVLEAVANPTERVPMPLDRWIASSGTTLANTAADLLVHSPQPGTAYTATYAPLTVPAAGRYRFALRYKIHSGRIAFGAFPPDGSRWLATDLFGHRTSTGREMAFTLDLKGGDTVLLRIANNNPANVAASLAIQDVSVTSTPPVN